MTLETIDGTGFQLLGLLFNPCFPGLPPQHLIASQETRAEGPPHRVLGPPHSCGR